MSLSEIANREPSGIHLLNYWRMLHQRTSWLPGGFIETARTLIHWILEIEPDGFWVQSKHDVLWLCNPCSAPANAQRVLNFTSTIGMKSELGPACTPLGTFWSGCWTTPDSRRGHLHWSAVVPRCCQVICKGVPLRQMFGAAAPPLHCACHFFLVHLGGEFHYAIATQLQPRYESVRIQKFLR